MNGHPLLGTTHTEALRLLENDATRVSLLMCEGLESESSDTDGVRQSSREPVSHAVEFGGLVVHVSELYVCASEEEERAEGAHLVLQGAVSVANSTLCVCSSASSEKASSGSITGRAIGLGLARGADGEKAMDEAGLVLESERVSRRRCVVDLFRQSKAANPNAEPEIIVDFFSCADCNTSKLYAFTLHTRKYRIFI